MPTKTIDIGDIWLILNSLLVVVSGKSWCIFSLNPYTASSPLTDTEKHHLETLPTSVSPLNITEFIISPTSYGTVTSNVTIEILNSSDSVIDIIVLPVNSSLEFPGTDSHYYPIAGLKSIVNVMNSVAYSLYYSLNR